MANKYDIIHIDFQASARGANAAIESIRKEAQQTSDKITELKKNIEAGVAAKMDSKVIDEMRSEQRVMEKRYKQLTQAQNELIKGMRVLDEGVKQFNNGALSQMNAAFQKSVNNAAKLAQSKMATGSKEWREMAVIMQETEQNYARMQRDTEQLITNLQNGGTVFVKSLEDEKKGLRELLQVLPYMGVEYRKAEEQLQVLVKTTDEMAIKERQLKGDIVTTNDARRVRLQLTEQGAEAARKSAEAAQAEIDKGKQMIDTLVQSKSVIEDRARVSAAAAAKYAEDLQMYDDYIAELNKEIDADKKAAKSRKEKAEQLRAEANSAQESADKQREAQKIVDQAYDEAAAKVENLKQQLKDLKNGQKQTTESTKESAEAKKEEVKVETQSVEAKKQEQISKEALTDAIKRQNTELKKLLAEKKAIIEAQAESTNATNSEAEAYKNLTKEQAQSLLEQKQAKATFKNEGGKWQVSNREEAQQYLFDTIGELEPNNLGKTHLELNGGSDSVNQLLGKFKERYGIQSDDDAMGAVRELMSGGLVKNGFMNKFILNLDQNTQKIDAFNNEIKALTDVINADTKATEENVEKKRTLEEVETDIAKLEKERAVNSKTLQQLLHNELKNTDDEIKKTSESADARNKNVESINAEIEAIKKLSKEQAMAMRTEMTSPSKIGFKANKVDASNIEEVQSFIISNMKKLSPSSNRTGDTLSLSENQSTTLLKNFQERYGFKGNPKDAKALIKQIVNTNEGLFKGGGEAFTEFNSIIVRLNTDAYEKRIAKLKELVKMTSDTAQATEKLSEATKKEAEASNVSAKMSDAQVDAITKQIEEVNRRYEAYDSANKAYEEKIAELNRLKNEKSNLPKTGADAALKRAELDDKIQDYNKNVVSPARSDRRRLKDLWERSQTKLVEMQSPDQGAASKTKNNTKATEENTQATEKNTKAKRDSAKASQEEIERKQKEAAVKQQLTEAEEALTAAKNKQRDEQAKTNRMDREALNKQQKAADAERNVGGKADEKMQELKQVQDDRTQLINDNKDTIKNNEINQKQLADINEKLKEQTDRVRENERIKAQANTEGIEKTEQAIRLLQDENRRIDTNSDKWKENTKDIQALQAALDEMKGKPTLMLMEERMGNVKRLSAAALTETKKFWEAMAAGASKGSAELKTAEANLKSLANEESKRNKASLRTKAGRLDNLGRYSEGEVRESIDAAKQLIQTYKVGGKDATDLANKIVAAEEYVKKYGLEAARAAQREADAIAEANKRRQESDELMRKQLEYGASLSESALKEQERYWQHLIDDPKTAAESLEAYKKELETVHNLQKQQADTANRNNAQKILTGTLEDYSEGEIREGIEAAKALRNEMQTGSQLAQDYATAIAKAEAHVKKYGVETARSAQQQAESDRIMRDQLNRMANDMQSGNAMPSENALKAQAQYWKRLIDDPKTAAKNVQAYRDRLAEVEKLQRSMVELNGKTALAWFQGGSDKDASGNQIKEMAAKLKEYRGTLLQETNAEEIAQIDVYLQRVGASAKKAAEDVMSLDDALKLAEGAGKDGFLASPQQMQQATKVLNERRDAVIKLIQENKALNLSTDEEEKELADLTKKLRDLKFEQDNFNMSQEKMRLLMETPAKAVNLEELREAIKRADAELKRMEGSLDNNSEEYKNFASQVKNAKVVLKEMESQSKANASAWEKAFDRLKTYVVMYMGFNQAIQRVSAMMDDLMTLSDKMGEVRKTTGWTADEVGRLSDNLKELDTRTSLPELMNIAARGGQLGLKGLSEIQGFTEAANQLMVALPEMGEEAATALMKIANATGDVDRNGGDVRETLERVGSTIIALRANSASAAPQITDFIKRVGAVGAQAGISIEQIAALGSTVDALGGRVEMSATALSRMIPAIKNNSFAVANAIGVTEAELKKLPAMQQMVLIFQKMRDSVKGFDTSTEEGVNAMADKVEKMLGNNKSMQEVMKTLNQQGARAGIVFGLLSQNVDELEKQLVTADEAYNKNIALMNEYNNMNDTAAGKWERLKNKIEEFWVSAENTSWLSSFIDSLHRLVDLITDEGPIGKFFRYSLIYLALLKAKWAETIGAVLISTYQFIAATRQSTAASTADAAAKTADAAATNALGAANKKAAEETGKLNKTMKANVITAVATAVLWLGMSLLDTSKKAKESAKQLNAVADAEENARKESIKERAELRKLYDATKDQTKSFEERKNALKDMVGNEKYNKYYKNLSTESDLAKAAAGAYKELAAQIMATARARALEAKAEELQQKRIELEDNKKQRETWRDSNKGNYQQGRQKYRQQQQYVEDVTSSVAGFEEAQISRRTSAAMKPSIITQYESNEKEIGRLDNDITKIDKDLASLQKRVEAVTVDLGNGNGGGGGGGTNPYGSYDKVKSNYNEWSGDDLVARRKEMLERVRALANGADVQAVLSEDAKFITDATRKNIKTTEQAIEWYNTERLKIQQALYDKHLTNTGDWKDPKNGARGWRKLIETDFDNYLRVLDAYYTERKANIEHAHAEEGLSEAEAQQKIIENETVWRKHRMELQQIYLGKEAQIEETERQRIYDIIAKQDEDSAAYVEKTIKTSKQKFKMLESMNDVEFRRVESKFVKGISSDLYKQQNVIAKQMDAISDIIAKERPFNGLTENLEKSLSTMGILFADFQKKRLDAIKKGLEPEDDTKQIAEQTNKRLMVLLSAAENAYSITWEQLKEMMQKEGFADWASTLEMDEQKKQAIMASLHSFYDSVQDAIKKESTQIKKQVDIAWNDMLVPGADGNNQSLKGVYEKAISALGLQQDSVNRANNLIGAGAASERVVDKLAIQQLKVRLAMQEHYYNLIKAKGQEHIKKLEKEAKVLEQQGELEQAAIKRLDVKHAKTALALSDAEEQTKLMEQQTAITNKLEESQNRLYTTLREWATLFASSIQGVMEASNAGNAEYYNERAKLDLTGKGGPGAGTYIVIDNEGTSNAEAHYEYLDERQALEREREIEQQNAQAEAWKKLMDDINMKLSETITDLINATLQNASIDLNTEALKMNTEALIGLSGKMGTPGEGEQGATPALDSAASGVIDGASPYVPAPQEDTSMTDGAMTGVEVYKKLSDASTQSAEKMKANNDKIAKSTKKSFTAMAAAANMYGIAYQTMANDNLSATQKVEMMMVQAAGQAAMSMLTASLAASQGETAANAPAWISKTLKELGPIGGPVAIGVFTALIGGLMGIATSKISKSKSQIAQVTGASINAGRLSTGMLAYAEGNVNEFSDPASLTPGRSYNVDAADGKTYRAKYTGTKPSTHLTNGPEFHLSGEKGREMIIDADTTRQITMNDNMIWRAIKTLSGGGRISNNRTRKAGRGIAAFADGNVDDFDIMGDGQDIVDGGMIASLQQSIDRNSDVLERALTEGIKGVFDVYGKGGLVDSYDTGKKNATRHGERY